MALPNSWILVKLADIGKTITGNTPPTKDINNYGSYIPFIKPPELNDEKIYSAKSFLSVQGAKKSRVLSPYSVLVSCIGNLGKTGLNKIPVAFNQQINAIEPFAGIMPEYLFYQAQSHFFRSQLESKSTATTISIVNKSSFEKVTVNIPPLPEQHRIVAKIEALFSELDKGVESLKTAREQLKTYRQALLKHAFSGKLTEQWRADRKREREARERDTIPSRDGIPDAAAEALLQRIQTEREQRYRQQLNDWEAAGKQGTKPKAPKTLPPLTAEELAELPELPEGWAYSRVGLLIDEPTYGTSKKCDYETNGIGVLRIPNVVSGKIDASDLKFAQFNDDEKAAYKLNTGDILLIRSNGSVSIVGRCALVSNNDLEYLYAGYLIMLRPNQKNIMPEYLLNLFSSHSMRKQIEHKAKSTSGVNNINSGEIQSLIVAICEIEEQKQIQTELESRLSVTDQLDQTLTTALQQAETLRQAILKKAFSGRLVPQDPNDEPASELLKRIQAEKAALVSSAKKRNL